MTGSAGYTNNSALLGALPTVSKTRVILEGSNLENWNLDASNDNYKLRLLSFNSDSDVFDSNIKRHRVCRAIPVRAKLAASLENS